MSFFDSRLDRSAKGFNLIAQSSAAMIWWSRLQELKLERAELGPASSHCPECEVQLRAVQALGEFGKAGAMHLFVDCHHFLRTHQHLAIPCYTYLKGWQNINEFKQFRLTPGCISLRTSHCWIARLWCEEFGRNCSCSAKTSTVAHTPRLHFLGSTSTEKGQDDNDPSIAYRRQVAMRPNDSYDHIWYDKTYKNI